MFPWQRFLAGHTVLCREIELQELRSYVSPLQDIKVDSPDSGLRSFAGHLTGPASTSSGLCCWKLRSGTFPPVHPESWGSGSGSSNCANVWLTFPCSVHVSEPGVGQRLL